MRLCGTVLLEPLNGIGVAIGNNEPAKGAMEEEMQIGKATQRIWSNVEKVADKAKSEMKSGAKEAQIKSIESRIEKERDAAAARKKSEANATQR